MADIRTNPPARPRTTFGEDFRRFFTRGLAALLPTLITLFILFWIFDTLWNSLGRHLVTLTRWTIWRMGQFGIVDERPARYVYNNVLPDDAFVTKLIGVLLAVLAVYIVGLLIGNLIGRTFWALAERAVMKIPLIRAIYPAVKQVTDFLLQDRKQQFESSRVVAVRMHNSDVWSIGLVTGGGLPPVSEASGEDTLTVFVPSSPTSFSGYVVVVPRKSLIELPLTTEEALRMLVSGGVITPARKLPGMDNELPLVGADATKPVESAASARLG
ncbi:MAG TPA: DUF502 domain-containing protein [Tepidisphaeraceae bacterium]|nr:DUF502 domain-containing protein [Tepidisphaeraceae bacterium]